MNKSIKNHNMLLLSNKFSAFHIESLANTHNNTARNAQTEQKVMPSERKQQVLPQILSPFLKHTVYNMFSQRRLQQLQPLLRQTNSNEKLLEKILKSKSLTQATKEQHLAQAKKHQPRRKQTKTEGKQFINEHLIPRRVSKIYTQTKSNAQFIKFEYADLKKSLDTIENLKQKPKQKTVKIVRYNTEESQQSSHASKIIFNKLQNLHRKESFVTFQSKQKEFMLKKSKSKQLKPTGFVLKQKLSKNMFKEQKQQIKIIKEVLGSSKGLDLSKGIKVKNYVNFYPTSKTQE